MSLLFYCSIIKWIVLMVRLLGGRDESDSTNRFNYFIFRYFFWPSFYFKYVIKTNMVDVICISIRCFIHCWEGKCCTIHNKPRLCLFYRFFKFNKYYSCRYNYFSVRISGNDCIRNSNQVFTSKWLSNVLIYIVEFVQNSTNGSCFERME